MSKLDKLTDENIEMTLYCIKKAMNTTIAINKRIEEGEELTKDRVVTYTTAMLLTLELCRDTLLGKQENKEEEDCRQLQLVLLKDNDNNKHKNN